MLGENLKTMRIQRGLTQEKLAEDVGVSRVNVAYFEAGTKVPSVATLERLADVLDCSVDMLLDRYKWVNK